MKCLSTKKAQRLWVKTFLFNLWFLSNLKLLYIHSETCVNKIKVKSNHRTIISIKICGTNQIYGYSNFTLEVF